MPFLLNDVSAVSAVSALSAVFEVDPFSWTHLCAQCAKESTMAKARYDKHSAEFRAEAIRLVDEREVPLARIARELGVKESTLRLW